MPELAGLLDELAGSPPGIDPEVVRLGVQRRRVRRRAGIAVAGIVAIACLVAGSVAIATESGEDPEGLDVVGPPPTSVADATPSPLVPGAWQALPPGPADGRTLESVVWTGDELIVWGGEGEDDADLLDTGAAFDPESQTWREIAPAPIAARSGHAAVWTGTEMIVCCGGVDPSGPIAAYDPTTDSWRTLEAVSELETIKYPAAVWTGERMVVAGGVASGSQDGALTYDPEADQWRGISELSPSVIERLADATWTGQEMAIVPGVLSDDPPVFYDPVADSWYQAPEPPADLAIDGPSAVWSGEELLLWGVSRRPIAGEYRAIGARFDREREEWRPMADAGLGPVDWFEGTPGSNSAVWDAERGRMLVATGAVGPSVSEGAAGTPMLAYNPTTDTWATLPPMPGGAFHPRMVLAGDLLMVEGADRFLALDLASGLSGDRPGQPVDPGGDIEDAGVFSSPTGAVLVSWDGGAGVQVIDLDGRRVVRRVTEGGRPGDHPFPVGRAGDSLVVGWGEIFAHDLATAEGRSLGDAVIWLPAAEDGAVWLVDWAEGRMGAGDTASYQLVGVDGEPRTDARPPVGIDPQWSAQRGIPGGLVFQTRTGVALWDAATLSVTHRFDVGAPGIVDDVAGGLIVWAADDFGATGLHLSTTSGDDRIVDPPPALGRFASGTASISPDGRTVAALAGHQTGPDDLFASTSLVLVDVPTGNTTIVAATIPEGAGGRLAWSADGRQVFFLGWSYGEDQTIVARHEVGSGELEVATLPFGGAIRLVALGRDEATALLEAEDLDPGACDIATYATELDVPACAFNF